MIPWSRTNPGLDRRRAHRRHRARRRREFCCPRHRHHGSGEGVPAMDVLGPHPRHLIFDIEKFCSAMARDLNLALAGRWRTLRTGAGRGGSGRAPGWCRCAVASLLRRGCGGAVCRKFSFCTPSPVHLSRTSSSLVASRRVSVSRMTQWLLLLTTSLLSTPLLLNSATCSP